MSRNSRTVCVSSHPPGGSRRFAIGLPDARKIRLAITHSWRWSGGVGFAVHCPRKSGSWIVQPLRGGRHCRSGHEHCQERFHLSPRALFDLYFALSGSVLYTQRHRIFRAGCAPFRPILVLVALAARALARLVSQVPQRVLPTRLVAWRSSSGSVATPQVENLSRHHQIGVSVPPGSARAVSSGALTPTSLVARA